MLKLVKYLKSSIGPILLVVALLYFCITFPLSKLMGALERRMKRGES